MRKEVERNWEEQRKRNHKHDKLHEKNSILNKRKNLKKKKKKYVVSRAGRKEFSCNLRKTKATTYICTKIIHSAFKILFPIKDCVQRKK